MSAIAPAYNLILPLPNPDLTLNLGIKTRQNTLVAIHFVNGQTADCAVQDALTSLATKQRREKQAALQ